MEIADIRGELTWEQRQRIQLEEYKKLQGSRAATNTTSGSKSSWRPGGGSQLHSISYKTGRILEGEGEGE